MAEQHKNYNIELRPITPGDMDLLYKIYANTRYEELGEVNWSKEDLENFLQMQFQAQHKQYTENYTSAEFKIIVLDQTDAGRLYTDIWDEEIRIMDIAILPEHRNKGCCTYLLKNILEKGTQTKKKVSIHVEKNNPALNLYHRLGFKEVKDREVYWLLEWTPDN